jgi:hypothetical protein
LAAIREPSYVRWQDALTGHARKDFDAWLARERDGAIARLLVARGEHVVAEQQYIRALDQLTLAVTEDARTDAGLAAYRNSLAGTRSPDAGA